MGLGFGSVQKDRVLQFLHGHLTQVVHEASFDTRREECSVCVDGYFFVLEVWVVPL